MPYYIEIKDAVKKSQAILDDRCTKMNTFLAAFPETAKATFTTPKLVWRASGRDCAGRCYLSKHIVEMNTNYLSSKDWKEFLHDTLIHELAHSIAYDLFKDCGHGSGWKMIAKFLGDSGSRCHNYATPTINKVERRNF